MKHFKLTEETKINGFGVKLHRIQATITSEAIGIKEGDLGGWVESEANLQGKAWVSGEGQIFGNARVGGNAYIGRTAIIYENAKITGKVSVTGNAVICGNVKCLGTANIKGPDDHIKQTLDIKGNVTISGDATVIGSFSSIIDGEVLITEDAYLSGTFNIIGDNILINGKAKIRDTTLEGRNIQITGNASLYSEFIQSLNEHKLVIYGNTHLQFGGVFCNDEADLFIDTNALLSKHHQIKKDSDFIYIENLKDAHNFTHNLAFYRGDGSMIYVCENNPFSAVRTIDEYESFLDREIYPNKTKQIDLVLDIIRQTL